MENQFLNLADSLQAYAAALPKQAVAPTDSATSQSEWSCSSTDLEELLQMPKPRAKPKSLTSKRERNKISASKYRLKRKKQALETERKLHILTNLVTLQKKKLFSLHRENKQLKMRVELIRNVLCGEGGANVNLARQLDLPLCKEEPVAMPMVKAEPGLPAMTPEEDPYFSTLINANTQVDLSTQSYCKDTEPELKSFPVVPIQVMSGFTDYIAPSTCDIANSLSWSVDELTWPVQDANLFTANGNMASNDAIVCW